MKQLKVNIICDEADGGWIYNEFIEQFKKYSSHKILVNEKDENKFDLYHYLPYYTFKQTNKPSTCWLSHMEKAEPLHSKFIQVAKSVDVGLSHSKKYATMLRDNHQCFNVMSIQPGVDTKKFGLRSVDRSANEKIIVGHVGRRYSSSNRKNPQLIEKISKMPFVDFKATDGKLNDDEVPGFIQSCDVIISPASIEGGPMCISQALSCGVPIIAMKGVGVADEFGEGVIKAESNDDFVARLKDMWMSKQHLTHWRQLSVMQKMRQQVETQTWEKFVFEHDKVWEMIISPSWRKSKE